MKVITVSKELLNPLSLPGMGRSLELNNISEGENMEIRNAYANKELVVRFEGEEATHLVIQLWPDPHYISRLTIFIK